ncbi:ketohexokinase [Anabrus simplex]|uniref:ketohexokinase n=1 Tax=Anabrus simplex TaxID=316456 RepID=UPI0035A27754
MSEVRDSIFNGVLKKLVSHKKILCVGMANVDNILICPSYPREDSDERSIIDQRTQVGGNAANNCTVLAALGIKCEFLGSLSNCSNTNFIIEHFKSAGICFDRCVYHAAHFGDRVFPNTTIIINDVNGSRTILHFARKWPEITLEDFKKVDLSEYSWIHFEGRNISCVKSMVQYIESWKAVNPSSSLRVSVELEMGKEETADLIPLGDVVVIGKDYAVYKGCHTMFETLEHVIPLTKSGASVIVPWGELGAVARSADGTFARTPAYSPPRVIDTLGAGDTFCAATIAALNSGCTLHEGITFGCQIAGAKVGMHGYDGLKIYSKSFHTS